MEVVRLLWAAAFCCSLLGVVVSRRRRGALRAVAAVLAGWDRRLGHESAQDRVMGLLKGIWHR